MLPKHLLFIKFVIVALVRKCVWNIFFYLVFFKVASALCMTVMLLSTFSSRPRASIFGVWQKSIISNQQFVFSPVLGILIGREGFSPELRLPYDNKKWFWRQNGFVAKSTKFVAKGFSDKNILLPMLSPLYRRKRSMATKFVFCRHRPNTGDETFCRYLSQLSSPLMHILSPK